MASVQTISDACLATLSRRDFLVIFNKAQKRKISEQTGFLRKFPFYSQFSNNKLQKIFYLLEVRHHVKGSVIFK